VVVVVGDVAIVVVLDVAGRVREFVPDRLALAVLVPSALDLIRGGRDAPVEALRELPRRGLRLLDLLPGSRCAGQRRDHRANSCRRGDLHELPSSGRERHELPPGRTTVVWDLSCLRDGNSVRAARRILPSRACLSRGSVSAAWASRPCSRQGIRGSTRSRPNSEPPWPRLGPPAVIPRTAERRGPPGVPLAGRRPVPRRPLPAPGRVC